MTAQRFEEIYQQYAKKLFRICLVFVKDEETAAGMVQNIFCSIWERRDTLFVENDWEKYLYRCAKLQYYNHSRNQTTKEHHLEKYSLQQARETNATEETVVVQQMTEQVDQLVADMPEKRRQVYRLSRQQGLTNQEIAQHLLISEKTVKNHLTKSLAYLRTGLKNAGYG
ncbi:MAG: RNA polymerase sigma-70 factor [Bacteroidota bacterium]